jgi:hypothetical protein
MNLYDSCKLTFKKLFFAEMAHMTRQLDEIGMMDKFVSQGLAMADQTYIADVIITPEQTLKDYTNLFTNMDE